MKKPHKFQSVLLSLCLLVSTLSFSSEKFDLSNSDNIYRAFNNTISNSVRSTLKSEIVKVSAVPNITVPPQSQSVCAGGNVTFFVTVTGTGSGNLVFLWKKNGVTITNAVGRISGANTASLTLSNITISDADNYTCVITDDIDSTNTITSDPATLIVNPIPSLVITNPPAVCSPATVNLTSSTITAGSDLGLRYEYYTDMIGTVLSTPNAVSTSGTYYIKAINEVTDCYDIKPVLVVINALPIVVTTAPLAVCAPATVDLTLTSVTASSTSGLTYTY
jgi:hypothetical protein